MTMKNTDIAQYALEALVKAGADKASCSVTQGRKEEFNIEANKFSLLRTLFNDSLSLKALHGGRKGVSIINKLDKDSIDKAVEDCTALALSATADDAEDIAGKAENKTFERSVAAPDMDSLFAGTKDFLELLGNEYPKILLDSMASHFSSAQTVFVNSNGVEFRDNHSNYGFTTMFGAKDGEISTSFNYYSADLSTLSSPFIDAGMQRTLLEEAVKSLNTRTVGEKFVGKIIVTPSCADMLWGTLLDCFLTDRPLIEGTSRWKDSLGTKVADSKLNFRLSPHHPAIIGGERFTGDGYESRDMDIIRDGILTSFVLSLYGSRKTGKPRATAFSGIEVSPGDTPLCDMIKGISRGVLLNRFSGGSPGPSGDVSGIAKNSFLIEDGKVTDALSETMVSFNILDILSNIPAISAERCQDGISVLPWCCFDGVTIS